MKTESLKKYLLLIIALLLSSVTNVSAQVAGTNLCAADGYTLGFFNGVWNTWEDAHAGREALMKLVGDKYNGEAITGEVFYNTSGILKERPSVSRLEDLAETFIQRSAELDATLQNRWEYFWELIDDDQIPLWKKLIQAIPRASDVYSSLRDAVRAKKVANLADMTSNPPTESDYIRHNARITALVTERKKLLFVAHSQGNLFVNRAYDTAVRLGSRNTVKVVHIAPASTITNGEHTRVVIDKIINALSEKFGNIPATNIFNIQPSLDDVFGHELIATYLDPTRPARQQIKDQLMRALSSLIAPATQGSTGFFTVTLTWDGSGDVDLHTFEPSGNHVYYRSKIGNAGVLDTDNTVSFGPEHYTATCDVNKLETGTYRIGINNYARATGRLATVQLASAKQGELKTKIINVGAVKGSGGNDSPIPVFTIQVTKDASGAYSVGVQ